MIVVAKAYFMKIVAIMSLVAEVIVVTVGTIVTLLALETELKDRIVALLNVVILGII